MDHNDLSQMYKKDGWTVWPATKHSTDFKFTRWFHWDATQNGVGFPSYAPSAASREGYPAIDMHEIVYVGIVPATRAYSGGDDTEIRNILSDRFHHDFEYQYYSQREKETRYNPVSNFAGEDKTVIEDIGEERYAIFNIVHASKTDVIQKYNISYLVAKYLTSKREERRVVTTFNENARYPEGSSERGQEERKKDFVILNGITPDEVIDILRSKN